MNEGNIAIITKLIAYFLKHYLAIFSQTKIYNFFPNIIEFSIGLLKDEVSLLTNVAIQNGMIEVSNDGLKSSRITNYTPRSVLKSTRRIVNRPNTTSHQRRKSNTAKSKFSFER